MFTDFDAVFHSLKSGLGLRPDYHHKKLRVDGHLFITVLAYQFVQIIRRTLQDHGIQGRWSSHRNLLSAQQRVTVSFRRADSGTLHVRKATRPEPALAAIYQALTIDPLPGGVKKPWCDYHFSSTNTLVVPCGIFENHNNMIIKVF